jgi:2-keto-4-pentenoate hydratase/2-oxohepta-3-ene-1,7-dioic acid hydratase in catechol pathway
MIHDIAAQIEHLTAAFTLEPGDVIYTGTPAGVGAGLDPPKWLKAGDTVRIEIDRLGHVENKVVEEPGTFRIG